LVGLVYFRAKDEDFERNGAGGLGKRSELTQPGEERVWQSRQHSAGDMLGNISVMVPVGGVSSKRFREVGVV
jgi:hypothetical protein